MTSDYHAITHIHRRSPLIMSRLNLSRSSVKGHALRSLICANSYSWMDGRWLNIMNDIT